MMKKLVAIALLSAAPLAFADAGLYLGANVAQAEYDEDGVPSAKPTALSFKVGNQFNQNFALEARVGTGLSSDEVTFLGVPVDVDIDNFYGVYAKGIIPFSDVFSAYGLVGYTHGEITASAGGFSVSESDGDFSFGIGADFALSKNVSLNLEWARLFEGDAYKVNALSLGVGYKF